MILNMFSIVIPVLVWNVVGASKTWNGWSPHDNNDRYQTDPLPVALPTIKTAFKQRWYMKLNGPVVQTPTVYHNRVYVSTIGGTFYCLRGNNGKILWQRNLSTLMQNSYKYFSRTSPLVYKDTIILGIMETALFNPTPGHGAYIIALSRSNGALRWKTLVSEHPASTITATPQLANDRLFVGISSGEEAFAVDPSYECCSFQGSVVALEARTGKFIWETKMIPDNNGTAKGYSG